MPTTIRFPADNRRTWILYALLIGVLSVVFFGSLADHPLDTHDQDYLADSAAISQDFSHFLSPQKSMPGRPAFELVLWLEYVAWGDKIGYFHLFGVLLHASASLLLALTCRKLGLELKLCLLGGLFFLVNTAHFQAIHWIAAHCYPLVLIYALLAVITYLRYTESGSLRYLFWTYVALLLGVLTHTPAAAVLPFFVYISWLRGQEIKPLIWRLLPLILLLAAVVYALKIFYPQAPQTSLLAKELDLVGILYNFLIFWSRLVSTAHWLPILLHEYRVGELLIGLLAIAALAVALARRISPLAEWTIWIGFGLLPFLTLDTEYIKIIPAGPSRYLYLSSAGSSVILAWGVLHLGDWLGRHRESLRLYGGAVLVLAILVSSFFSLKKTEAISFYAAARNYIANGDTEEAIVQFGRVLKHGSDAIDREDVYTRLCLMKMARGHNIDLLLEEALRDFPENNMLLIFKDVLESMGPASQARGRALGRVDAYREDRRWSELTASAYFNAGRGLRRRGDIGGAIRAFRRSLEFGTQKENTLKALVNALLAAGRWEEAIPLIVDLGPQRPGETDASYFTNPLLVGRLAAEYIKKGRIEEGVEKFERAFRLDPDNYKLRVIAGKVYLNNRLYDRALDTFRQAITLQPSGYESYVGMGTSLRALGRFQEARQACRQAAALEPENPLAYHKLGDIETEVGNRDEALEAYRRSIFLGSDNTQTYVTLGLLLEEDGKRSEALGVYQKIMERDFPGTDVDFFGWLGLKLYQLDQIDASIEVYNKALEMDPGNVKALYNQGWNFYRKGNLDSAIAAYLLVLKNQPDFAAHFNLGLAYLAGGNVERAKVMYEQGIARFGTEGGERLEAPGDLAELIGRGVQVAGAREILEVYWPQHAAGN